MTWVAIARRSSRDTWFAIRALASASSMPRDATSRSTAVSTGTSTTTVALRPSRGRSARSGKSSTTTSSVLAGVVDAAGDLDGERRVDDVVQCLQRGLVVEHDLGHRGPVERPVVADDLGAEALGHLLEHR